MKRLLCFFTSIFSLEQPAESVVAFLDKEQRPGAQIVTESFVDFAQSGEDLIVKGVLGAIHSDRKPGSFVAFSGVTVGKNSFESQEGAGALAFDLKEVKAVETLTVQLVLQDKKIFGYDLALASGEPGQFLPFTEFRESFRGRFGDLKFNSQLDQIAAVKFFLKRSENLPTSSDPLDFSFSLSKLRFVK